MKQLSIVLVNYRAWSDTLACIASLRNLDYSPVEIIVVENGSEDDSWERLRGVEAIRLIKVERNLGFAGGCNVGLRAARDGGAEFVWLLNNDTLVESHAASALIELAQRRPEAHFFGNLISFAAEPERLWFGGGEFEWDTGTPRHTGFMQPVEAFSSPEAAPTGWITGCSLLVRTSSLDVIGLMDEDFFLYSEDLEWQLRARRKYPVAWIVRQCLVHHKVGQSTGGTNDVMGRVFMSRNFLKLALGYAGLRMPLWLARWAIEFLAKPALKGNLRLLRAGFAGLSTQRIAGGDIVRRWGRGERG